jgi:hypothetical protein
LLIWPIKFQKFERLKKLRFYEHRRHVAVASTISCENNCKAVGCLKRCGVKINNAFRKAIGFKPASLIIIIIIIVPVTIGTLGTIKKGSDQNLQLLPGHRSATELQKVTLMSTAQSIVKCWGKML